MHLRREEEVISADDGHAESGRSAEEGAQRVAAAHLGAGGMAGWGGTPACPRSSHPHTQAEPRTAAREFGRVSEDRGVVDILGAAQRGRCEMTPQDTYQITSPSREFFIIIPAYQHAAAPNFSSKHDSWKQITQHSNSREL